MAKKMLTKSKQLTREQKLKRIQKQTLEFTGDEVNHKASVSGVYYSARSQR